MTDEDVTFSADDDRHRKLRARREHAATGPLPPAIAAGFTVGELAVLKVLSDEVLAHGLSDRSLNELAARAGVCRSLAKRTIQLAELDGLITVQRRPRSRRKHLCNVAGSFAQNGSPGSIRPGAGATRPPPAAGPSQL